ncbi:hypothetical protein sos41_29430 [Alphaproteobacteria bacterium SO-S41]|nr:hypothetical protein sos41_29430 [Alphaproteobacteria bacterium SO-S41]
MKTQANSEHLILTMTEPVPIILTIKEDADYHQGNYARLDILLRSLDHFASSHEFDEILLVTPDRELPNLRSHLARSPTVAAKRIECVSDSAIVPGIESHPAAPWYKQQVLKLAAHRRWPGRFYMTMDADIFATQRFSMSQFIVDGRSLLDTETREHQWRWFAASAAILDMDAAAVPAAVMTVTPCIYHASVVAAVLDEIERLHPGPWDQHLLARCFDIEWTEHAIYFLGAIKLGLLDKFHFLGPAPQAWRLHSLNAVYMAEVWPGWDTPACFSGWTGVFTCIASSARIPVADIEAKIAGYIP